MPDTQFIALILLLVVAVIAGYFYLKRAQRRDHTLSDGDVPPSRGAGMDGDTHDQ